MVKTVVLEKLKSKCIPIGILSSEFRKDKSLYFYHIVINETAFEKYFDLDIAIQNISKKYKDHVHLTAYSENILESNSEVYFEQICDSNHEHSIEANFFTSEMRHDFVCDFKFEILSLTYLTEKKILSSLGYLHDKEKLPILKYFKEILFKHSEKINFLPKFHNQIAHYTDPTKIDCIYDKNNVVAIQNTDYLELHGNFVVSNFFLFNGKILLSCTNCLNFITKKRGYWCRFYKLSYDSFHGGYANFWTQEPLNWCLTCKQVPLFQILTLKELMVQYRVRPYVMGYHTCICKREYFKDGIKIASEPCEKRILKRKKCFICT